MVFERIKDVARKSGGMNLSGWEFQMEKISCAEDVRKKLVFVKTNFRPNVTESG